MNETGLRWPRVNKSKNASSESDRQDDSRSDESRDTSPSSPSSAVPPTLPHANHHSSKTMPGGSADGFQYAPASGKYREGIVQQGAHRYSPYPQHHRPAEYASHAHGYAAPEHHYAAPDLQQHYGRPASSAHLAYPDQQSVYETVQMTRADYSMLMEELHFLRNENYNLKLHLQQRDARDYHLQQQQAQQYSHPSHGRPVYEENGSAYGHSAAHLPVPPQIHHQPPQSAVSNTSEDSSAPKSATSSGEMPMPYGRRASIAPPPAQQESSLPSLPTRYTGQQQQHLPPPPSS